MFFVRRRESDGGLGGFPYGPNKYVAFACTVDGSSNPLWQIGTCTDLSGNGFVSVFELNAVTGVIKVNGVTLVVP